MVRQAHHAPRAVEGRGRERRFRSPFYAQFDPRLGFQVWLWDRRQRVFDYNWQPVRVKPNWILLQESPLPSVTQQAVTDLLGRDYEPVAVLRAFDPGVRGNVYDRQDEFYLPFAGFDRVRRAGPNFLIYKHSDVAILNGSPCR